MKASKPKLTLGAAERLTAAPSPLADARDTIKALYQSLEAEGLTSVWEAMPSEAFQNDERTLGRACRACLKAGNLKGAKLARLAYGKLICAEIITPF